MERTEGWFIVAGVVRSSFQPARETYLWTLPLINTHGMKAGSEKQSRTPAIEEGSAVGLVDPPQLEKPTIEG
jgi:hypothetical protein